MLNHYQAFPFRVQARMENRTKHCNTQPHQTPWRLIVRSASVAALSGALAAGLLQPAYAGDETSPPVPLAAQATGLRYVREGAGKPNCFESPDVRALDAQRDIPFIGTLTAVLVPTDTECACPITGMIFDDQTTLIVDCLHGDDEVDAFLATARDNEIATVRELTTPILAPCPPPTNQATLADWRETLFREYRPR